MNDDGKTHKNHGFQKTKLLNLYVLLPMYEPAEIDSFFL